MVCLLDKANPLFVEGLPFSAVFPELLQERRDRVGGQGDVWVVAADKGSAVLSANPASGDFWLENAK